MVHGGAALESLSSARRECDIHTLKTRNILHYLVDDKVEQEWRNGTSLSNNAECMHNITYLLLVSLRLEFSGLKIRFSTTSVFSLTHSKHECSSKFHASSPLRPTTQDGEEGVCVWEPATTNPEARSGLERHKVSSANVHPISSDWLPCLMGPCGIPCYTVLRGDSYWFFIVEQLTIETTIYVLYLALIRKRFVMRTRCSRLLRSPHFVYKFQSLRCSYSEGLRLKGAYLMNYWCHCSDLA